MKVWIFNVLVAAALLLAHFIPIKSEHNASCSSGAEDQRYRRILGESDDYSNYKPDPPGPAELCGNQYVKELYIL